MGQPNLLLITLDQFRADCLGAANHPVVQTPNLDRLASQGVRFSNHYANCAPCAPSRASLLTGLWQMNHRVTDNGAPLSDMLPNLPRQLRSVGYEPVLFGYTDTALDPATLADDDERRTSYEQPMPGFDVKVLLDGGIEPWLKWLTERGYEIPDRANDIYEPEDVPVPEGRGATWRPARYAAEHSESAFITTKALEWMNEPGRSDEPWCAHLSYLRPHPPYLAPAPYHDMFDPADVPPSIRAESPELEAALHPFLAAALSIVPSPLDDLNQRQLQATYYGMIAEVDHQIGVLLDGLEELGFDDDTVVVLTSDHGEQLGDHWLIEKLGFFDQSYRIPLIIRAPRTVESPGRVVDEFTENVDVTPTLLDLAGAPPQEFCDGSSLRPLLDQSCADGDWWRTAVHYEYDFRQPTTDLVEQSLKIRQDQCAISVLRDHRGKYVHFAAGLPPLFFDLRMDDRESKNCADDPSYAPLVLDYAQRLLNLSIEHRDPRLANSRTTPSGTLHRSDPPRSDPPRSDPPRSDRPRSDPPSPAAPVG